MTHVLLAPTDSRAALVTHGRLATHWCRAGSADQPKMESEADNQSKESLPSKLVHLMQSGGFRSPEIARLSAIKARSLDLRPERIARPLAKESEM